MWRVESRDEHDEILLYKPTGAPYVRSAPGDGLESKLGGSWSLIVTSNSSASLVVHGRGRWSSVWLMWDEGHQFGGWYVNFEEPWTDVLAGYQTVDMALDIVVRPNGEWMWKDRDEFDALIAAGSISDDAASEVLAEGERIVAEIDARAWVFDEEWVAWLPPTMVDRLPPPSP